MLDILDVVKSGYDALQPTRPFRDPSASSVSLPIFEQWFRQVKELSKSTQKEHISVLELGCGRGEPVGRRLSLEKRPYCYTGIDISETAIEEAAGKFGDKPHIHFETAEMLTFCKNRTSKSVAGVVSLFAIFHLPREHHVSLFCQIRRILIPGGSLLITMPEESGEGFQNEWLGGGEKMWISNFSVEWVEMTLAELGFELLTKYKEMTSFIDDKESTWWLLFRAS